MTSRFASLTEQDIEKIVESNDSQNTKRSTKVAKELFVDYVKEKNLREPEEKKELAQTLKTFYVEARKKDGGSSYSMGSLKTLRFGLNRHFKSTRGIDIINDVEFNEANKVLTAQCVQLKKDGRAKVQHKPPILDDDLKKLYESGVLYSDHPKTLLKCSSKSCCVFADVVFKIYDN